MSPAVLRVLGLGAGLLLAGCSSFDSRWQAARKTSTADPYAGAWDGKWISSSHAGVQDRLRCILTPTKDGHYHAEFKAKWLKVFTSEHEVVFQTKPRQGDTKAFSGTAALNTFIGKGTYSCAGTMTPSRLTAKYDSTYDTGKFVLER